MSAISSFLTFLRSAIYAIDVRDGIADAIEQCYNDVNNPTLKTEALEAALQNKIDQGEMAALTIGDHTITAAKLANGVIPAADATLTETGKPADAAETGRQIGLLKADLGAQVPQLNLLNAIQSSKGFGKNDSNVYFADTDGKVGIILRDGFDSANADIKMYYHPEYKNGVVIDGDGNVLGELSPVGSLAGLKLSILGDSISTYSGYIPSGYATYYPHGDVDNVSKTWWHKLLDMSGMVLLKNASWSGSRVSGDTSLTTGQTGCSDARINALKDGDTKPDIIICYISTNDWANGVSVGTYDSTEDVDLTTQVITNISDAYAVMLYKIRNAYPDAHVYCVTSLEGRRTSGDTSYPILNANNESIHQANHAIAEIAHIFGAKVIDLQTCGIHYWNVSSYTVDGTLHPNNAGTTVIANAIYNQLKRDFA